MNEQTDTSPAPNENPEVYGELTGHVYDGIQEYDNPTPGWWNWLFAGSFFFSLAYLLVFHIGSAPGIHAQYETAFAANLRTQFSEIGELSPDRATIVQYVNEPKWLKVGESVYKQNCSSCHGPQAAGLIGPNLTDDHWINVNQIEDIARVLQVGAANGAMPAWQNRLHPNEIVLTAAYVASLRGSSPANPKAPEPKAKIIPAWPAAPAETGSNEETPSPDSATDE